MPSSVLSLGIAALLIRWRPLNALVAGEETATSLGIDVTWFRAELFVLTLVAGGVLVAVTGAIAFVGLIVPHVARLLVGADHRRVLPVSAVLVPLSSSWSTSPRAPCGLRWSCRCPS